MPKISKKQREKLFRGFGPFANFATRIEVALAMELIDEPTYHDLNVIRGIRNKFAHPQTYVHFQLDQMKEMLRKFRDYDSQMDPLLFFGKKVDHLWAALNPRLGSAAARELGMIGRGLAFVKVEVIAD